MGILHKILSGGFLRTNLWFTETGTAGLFHGDDIPPGWDRQASYLFSSIFGGGISRHPETSVMLGKIFDFRARRAYNNSER